jgi:UDP-N-acetylmuramoyl-tripeptide--D-alanyl-D-alanine ligase
MLELGPYEVRGHEMVGVRAAEVVDELVTVGRLGHIIAETAHKSGLPSRAITHLDDTQQAIDFLKPRLMRNDVVLVKGSHGMRMDRIVAALEHRR